MNADIAVHLLKVLIEQIMFTRYFFIMAIEATALASAAFSLVVLLNVLLSLLFVRFRDSYCEHLLWTLALALPPLVGACYIGYRYIPFHFMG